MKILVTGCAGFIGFHICEELLSLKNISIIGIDNINNYYSKKIKNKRLKILKDFKRFTFYKTDIANEKSLRGVFKKNQFDIVIHMAAQAGVRHALKDPSSYLDSNLKGYINLIENIKNTKIKKMIFASSSSVYGESKKFPLSEHTKTKPINIYSSTKLLNEEIAKDFSEISKIKFIGLRFFTIYGKYGRPDMFLFKVLKSIYKNKKFYLNNHGNHFRDFTHITDVRNIVLKLVKKKIRNNYQIFNICSNKPIKISKLINEINKITKINLKVLKVKKHKSDVIKTHGNNTKIKKFLILKKFKNIYYELQEIIEWYKKNKYYNF